MTAPDRDDRSALAGLVAAYARCVDRRDYAGLAGLFADGSRVGKFEGSSETGYWRDGGEVFASSVRDNHARYTATTHLLAQHDADLDGDRATGEAYCLAHHVYADEDGWRNRVMAIRYLDDYGRFGAGWLFTQRRILVDWIEYRPMGAVPLAEGWRPV